MCFWKHRWLNIISRAQVVYQECGKCGTRRAVGWTTLSSEAQRCMMQDGCAFQYDSSTRDVDRKWLEAGLPPKKGFWKMERMR